MATINNSELIKGLIDNAKINISTDRVPTQLAEKIVPVMEVNPELLKKTTFTKADNVSGSGGFNLITTKSNKDFFLTGLYLHYIKDATCDIATGSLMVGITTEKGSTYFNLPVITLTAQSDNLSIPFKNPLKLNRNSNISVSGTFGAGVLVRSAAVTGYYVED